MESSHVSEYEDKAEIIELINLYAFAIDSHSWDLFDRIFTDDVRADYGADGAVWSTRSDLVSAFDAIHKVLDRHQHTMMGHLVHVDGDKAYAFTYGNWLLIKYGTEGGPTWLGTGWYDDELVRTDRGWRIKHRISRIISYSGNPNVPQIPQPVDDETPDPTTAHVLFHEAGEIRYFNAIKAS
jgi:hypothetical protein